jgi:hypothetical protein
VWDGPSGFAGDKYVAPASRRDIFVVTFRGDLDKAGLQISDLKPETSNLKPSVLSTPRILSQAQAELLN